MRRRALWISAKTDGDTASTIASVRDAFVGASLGELPSIRSTMLALGLVDVHGRASGPVTEEEVRAIATREEWRQQRAEWIREMDADLLPEEVDLVRRRRRLDLERQLSKVHEAHSAALISYYEHGEARSTGGSRLSDFKPDLAVLPLLAESVCRLVAADLGKIVVTAEPTLSPWIAAELQRLEGMSDQEIEVECSRLDSVRRALPVTDETEPYAAEPSTSSPSSTRN